MSAPLHLHIASKADMMRHHDPVRIQGYCASCEKHGRYWSCPPFASPPLAGLPHWETAVILCQKTLVAPGSTKDSLLTQFLEARGVFAASVIEMERRLPRVTALIAGHCAGCAHCTRPEGKACNRPTRMHYSLEAVGFDVTGLAEGLAGQKLHWPKEGLPDYLTTVGALLCPDSATAHALVAHAGRGTSVCCEGH